MNMKFVKGMILGTIVSTGVMMMVTDNPSKRKLMKKGRQIAKRMGMW